MIPSLLALALLGCTDPAAKSTDTAGGSTDGGTSGGSTDGGSTDGGTGGGTGGTGDLPTAPPATDPLWDPRSPASFYVYTDSPDWFEELRALSQVDECERKPYAAVDVRFVNPVDGSEEYFEDVGWRFRGQSAIENMDEPYERVGFKLSFNEFVDGRRFQDLRKINLLGTEGDYSIIREHLALGLMRAMGVPAPRSTYALLYVNDELQGVFPNTEEADDEPYLEHTFGDDSGSLYKAEGYCGWMADFDDEGDEPRFYEETYEPRADTVADDMYSDLIPMIKCVNEPDDADFEACIPSWIDVDEWLIEMAVDAVLPDVDGMLANGQNFMLYHDPSRGRFVVYPWDKDQAFSRNNLVENWTIADFHPTWNPEFRSLLGSRLIATREQEYCQAVLAAAALYDPAVLLAQVQDLVDFLSPYIEADPFLEIERWGWAVEDNIEVIEAHYQDVVDQATACAL